MNRLLDNIIVYTSLTGLALCALIVLTTGNSVDMRLMPALNLAPPFTTNCGAALNSTGE